jgi:hypothetical protein
VSGVTFFLAMQHQIREFARKNSEVQNKEMKQFNDLNLNATI